MRFSRDGAQQGRSNFIVGGISLTLLDERDLSLSSPKRPSSSSLPEINYKRIFTN